jgi:hypothetical protein
VRLLDDATKGTNKQTNKQEFATMRRIQKGVPTSQSLETAIPNGKTAKPEKCPMMFLIGVVLNDQVNPQMDENRPDPMFSSLVSRSSHLTTPRSCIGTINIGKHSSPTNLSKAPTAHHEEKQRATQDLQIQSTPDRRRNSQVKQRELLICRIKLDPTPTFLDASRLNKSAFANKAPASTDRVKSRYSVG